MSSIRGIDLVTPHQLARPLHQPQLQHLGLDLDVPAQSRLSINIVFAV